MFVAFARKLQRAFLALSLLAGAMAPAALAADAAKVAPQFESETLTISSRNGASHRFAVELALDGPQREYGLMFRTTMAADHGMLFDFEKAQHVQMWMENTVLPLDMLFLDASGTVTHIVENAVPYSRAIIDSAGPVKYVIEVNAGTVRKLRLAVGDRVTSPTIGRG